MFCVFNGEVTKIYDSGNTMRGGLWVLSCSKSCLGLLKFSKALKNLSSRLPPPTELSESLKDHWIINAWESPQLQHLRKSLYKKAIRCWNDVDKQIYECGCTSVGHKWLSTLAVSVSVKPIKHFTTLYYYPTICKQTLSVCVLYGFLYCHIVTTLCLIIKIIKHFCRKVRWTSLNFR